MLANATHGTYQGDVWGSWKLMKSIQKADLGSIPASVLPGYNYSWSDSGVVAGSTYSYYVSAWKEGTYAGPGGDITNRIETHYTNRNGASGLWVKTFPFATTNANFPTDGAGKKAIGAAIMFGTTSVGDQGNAFPSRYELAQNYPNPFNPSTKINYNLPVDSKVTLEVYNIIGNRISQLINKEQSAGSYSVNFNSSSLNKNISSGVYFYKLTAVSKISGNNFSSIKKMILLK